MHFDESFWVAVSFFTFIFLVAKPVGRFIAAGLDKRSHTIKEELDEAMRLKEEAQALLASYQRKQRKAVEEAEEILDHARDEAERITRQAQSHLEQEIAKRTEIALQKIAQAQTSVVQEIRDNAVDITVSASRMLLEKHLDKKRAEELITDAVSSIDRKLH